MVLRDILLCWTFIIIKKKKKVRNNTSNTQTPIFVLKERNLNVGSIENLLTVIFFGYSERLRTFTCSWKEVCLV
jgi:hypothetical protein